MQLRANNPTDYLYILSTILFTVYGQVVLKWQMNRAGPLPADATEKLAVLARMLLNPWVLSCVVAGVLVMFSWMVALTRFPLTYAYPFMSTTFVLVLLLGAAFFGEAVTTSKAAGVALIALGVVIGSRG
jgi:drug/metabolite transporter (DMT)-like permease